MLEFFNLNSTTPVGEMAMYGERLVSTGVAEVLAESKKAHGMTDAEIFKSFGAGWTNGYYYTKLKVG